jgi:hypothetical protein
MEATLSEALNKALSATQEGAVRIGSGEKLHPASIDERYGLMILCSCPGTQQGSAYKRARFFHGAKRTCKT